MMKAYISGKITGDSQYREKFQRAQKALQKEGFIVLNPAELPDGMLPSDYMRICFAMMECADVVAFLPDYSQSRGARMEFDWCQYTGKMTMFLESMSFYREATFTDDSDSTMMMYEIASEIEDAPAADVAPVRHGRWLSWDELHGGNTLAKNVLGVFCSECIRQSDSKTRFCHNCGARMDKEALECDT